MNPPVGLDGATMATPVGFATADVMAKAGAENFPVATRLLPRRIRQQLLAIYGYARFVDDVGDVAAGDRLAQLEWVEAELDRALAGAASHPVFVAVGRLAAEIGVGRRPFVDLIEANRQDQVVTRYPSYEHLEAYCALSANPVGRLVLAVFGRRDAESAEFSDRVCTALQLVEHFQDVAEDFAAGRVYLPAEDLTRFGVGEPALAAGPATPAVRRLMAFEAARARRLLQSGRPLVAELSGWGRLAVAGFVGGGLAQLDAIERRGYDVLSGPVKATRARVTSSTLGVWVAARSKRP
ncbi:MAG: squalene synthase HpnC [Acidimicrobiales bacterium]|jgi:squalene synthase HpnC